MTTERTTDYRELPYIRRGTTLLIDIEVRDAAQWTGFDTPAPEPILFDPNGRLVYGRLTNSGGVVVDWGLLAWVREGIYRWQVEVPIDTVEGLLDLDLRATAGVKTTQTTSHSLVRVVV